MFRILFSLFFWVTVARWGYQEIKLIAPETLPIIDRFVETITPPTHDRWPSISLTKGEEGISLSFSVNEREDSVHPLEAVREFYNHYSKLTAEYVEQTEQQ